MSSRSGEDRRHGAICSWTIAWTLPRFSRLYDRWRPAPRDAHAGGAGQRRLADAAAICWRDDSTARRADHATSHRPWATRRSRFPGRSADPTRDPAGRGIRARHDVRRARQKHQCAIGKLTDFVSSVASQPRLQRRARRFATTLPGDLGAAIVCGNSACAAAGHEVATLSNSYPVAEMIPPLTTVALPPKRWVGRRRKMVIEQVQAVAKRSSPRCPERDVNVRKSTGPLGINAGVSC